MPIPAQPSCGLNPLRSIVKVSARLMQPVQGPRSVLLYCENRRRAAEIGRARSASMRHEKGNELADRVSQRRLGGSRQGGVRLALDEDGAAVRKGDDDIIQILTGLELQSDRLRGVREAEAGADGHFAR